jgi:hypothetical protein
MDKGRGGSAIRRTRATIAANSGFGFFARTRGHNTNNTLC